MPIWTLDKPPTYKPDAVATESGWEDPVTGEVLDCIGHLATKAGAADIVAIEFDEAAYVRGDALSVTVRWNEAVTVTSGLAISIANTGSVNPIGLYTDGKNADGDSGTHEAVFKWSDATVRTTVLVPNEDGELSVSASALSGTQAVTDTLGGTKASGRLVLTAVPLANEQVVIGAQTYVYKATVATTANEVKIGSSVEFSLNNLYNAVVGGEGSGTAYGSQTVANPQVDAAINVVSSVEGLLVTAKSVGTAGNSIATTETLTNGAWAGAQTTLIGGAAASTSNKTISAAVKTATGTRTISKVTPTIESVAFGAQSYTVGDTMEVVVTYDIDVDVTAGAQMLVAKDSGSLTLTAAEQLATTEVVFSATVPSADNEFSIAAQTISGTIEDSEFTPTVEADLTISTAQAAAAGSIVVTTGDITAVAFGAQGYQEGAQMSVVVTYDEAVDVVAGAQAATAPKIKVSYAGAQTGTFYAFAGSQSNTATVTFNKDNAGALLVVPAIAGSQMTFDGTALNVGTGSIKNTGTQDAANLALVGYQGAQSDITA